MLYVFSPFMSNSHSFMPVPPQSWPFNLVFNLRNTLSFFQTARFYSNLLISNGKSREHRLGIRVIHILKWFLCPFPALWSWVCFLTLLNLSLLIYKMQIGETLQIFLNCNKQCVQSTYHSAQHLVDAMQISPHFLKILILSQCSGWIWKADFFAVISSFLSARSLPETKGNLPTWHTKKEITLSQHTRG